MVTSKWLPPWSLSSENNPEALPPSVLSLPAQLPSHQSGFMPAHPTWALAKLVLSDVSHTTQGSRVACPEMLILGA